jgi:hypothetical protein
VGAPTPKFPRVSPPSHIKKRSHRFPMFVAQKNPSNNHNQQQPPSPHKTTTENTIMIPIMYNSCGMPQLAMSITASTSTRSVVSKGDITEKDVLCGRDKITHSHGGNKRFLSLIKKHREAYQNSTSREDKTRLSSDIVKMIRFGGGRFLKCTNDSTGEYEDQDDIVAREKVAHALRSCKADSSRSKKNDKSIKRTRVVKKHEPTERENALFAQALQFQRQLFQQLLSETDSTIGSSDEDSHSDDSSSSSSSATKSSGESQSSSDDDNDDELNAATPTPLEALDGIELDLDMEAWDCLDAL